MNATHLTAAVFFSLACSQPQPVPTTSTTLTSATTTSAALTSAPSAALTSTAQAPSSSVSAPIADGSRQAPEEEQFWIDLAMAYNAKLSVCKGWTGDGTITVKNGKIVSFEILDGAGGKGTPQPKLKGVAVPTIPASLTKEFEGPVSVSVCTDRARR